MTHIISYAYPTSTVALQLKMPKGCYVLEIEGQPTKGFPTLNDALAVVPEGSEPGRWSIDHPANHLFAV